MGFDNIQKAYQEAAKLYSDVKKEPSKHVVQLSTYLAELTKAGLNDVKAVSSELQELVEGKRPGAQQAAMTSQSTDAPVQARHATRYQTATASAVVKCRFTSFSMPMPWQ